MNAVTARTPRRLGVRGRGVVVGFGAGLIALAFATALPDPVANV